MKKYLLGLVVTVSLLGAPLVASAATLTPDQVSAIIGVLQSFGVNQTTIDLVRTDLTPGDAINTGTTTPSVPSVIVPVMNPLEVWSLRYDNINGRVYLWGNKIVDAADVTITKEGDTAALPVTFTTQSVAYNHANDTVTVNGIAKSGGYSNLYYPSSALTSGAYSVTFTGADGTSATSNIYVN